MSVSLNEIKARENPSSDIFVVNGSNGADDGFISLASLMKRHGVNFYKTPDTPNGIIPSYGVVLVKVNSQWNERGGTNTDLVKSIIMAVTKHPEGFSGEVVIVDNGQAQFGSTRRGGSMTYDENNALDTTQSNQVVADSFKGDKVTTYLWDSITTTRVKEYDEGDLNDGYIIDDDADLETGIRVSYPKFRTKHGSYISFKEGVWDSNSKSYDSDKLIVLNVPVLKAHFIYGVTACVKHYMGVVSDKLQSGGAHRSVRNGGMGTMMVKTRRPNLNILDGIYVNSNCGGGPSCTYDNANNLELIMASVDPVALDVWATENVLMEAARNQGSTDLSKFDPHTIEPGSHGEWMKKSLEQMEKAGLQVTDNPNRFNVYVTSL